MPLATHFNADKSYRQNKPYDQMTLSHVQKQIHFASTAPYSYAYIEICLFHTTEMIFIDDRAMFKPYDF